MLPYQLMMVLTAGLGLLLCERSPSRKKDAVYLAVVTVAMVAMAGLRADTVGIDYEPYTIYFNSVLGQPFSFLFSQSNQYLREPVFGFINWAVSRVSSDMRVLMAVASGLIIVIRAAAVWRLSSSVWMSMFVYSSFGFFGYALCTLRQELGISVVLFAIPFLQQKRFWPYLAVVTAAGLCHTSLFVLLPVFWLAWLPINRITLSLYAAGTIALGILTRPILSVVTSYVFTNYALSYLWFGRDFRTAFIPMVYAVVMLLLSNRLRVRKKENLVLVNFAVWTGVLYILTIAVFLYQRIALVFFPLSAMLLLPEVLSSLRPKAQPLRKGEKRTSLRDAKSLYVACIGYTIFTGFVYNLFLLSANRLRIVPYVTFLG